jgi:predicted kinase
MLEYHWWQEGYERLPAATRALVTALVRWHARPIHGEHKLEAHVAASSMLTRCDLLAILAEADMRGRICDRAEQEGALLQIELFREAARELNCFDRPYVWANAHACWTFFQKGTEQILWQGPDDRRFTVHMLCGLPGSGKSSVSARLGLPIVSRDDLRSEAGFRPGHKKDEGRTSQMFQQALREHLRAAKDFVVDGTNLIKNLRGNTIELAANYGARIHLHYVDRDRKTTLKQNREREAAVPEDVIERMAAGFERPDVTECHVLHSL